MSDGYVCHLKCASGDAVRTALRYLTRVAGGPQTSRAPAKRRAQAAEQK